MGRVAAVILTGGGARRLGGLDKPGQVVGGRTLLARVLAACVGLDPQVVVGPAAPEQGECFTWNQQNGAGGGGGGGGAGPPEELVRRELIRPDLARPERVQPDSVRPSLVQVREDPPGGGPVAALAAGLVALPADVELLAFLAADQPFLTPEALTRLLDALSGHEGALYVDETGRRQLLCGVWQRAALQQRMPPNPDGWGIGRLVAGLRIVEVTSSAVPPPWFDCDTPAQLAQAREWASDTGR